MEYGGQDEDGEEESDSASVGEESEEESEEESPAAPAATAPVAPTKSLCVPQDRVPGGGAAPSDIVRAEALAVKKSAEAKLNPVVRATHPCMLAAVHSLGC